MKEQLKIEIKSSSAKATDGKEEKPKEKKAKKEKELEKKPEKEKKRPEAKEKERPEEESKKTIAELKEEMERLQTVYAPLGWFRKEPVVKDLGYYVNQNKIEEIKKEIENLESKKPAVSLKGKQAGPLQSEGLGREEKVEEKKEGPVKTHAAGSAVGEGIKMGESAEDIESRLQELSVEIPASSVLGRSKLEKEQKRLEKRLKELKKSKKLKRK